MKILVVGPSWVGDAVLAQPFFQRLRQRHQGLRLDVLAPPWVVPLLQRMPQIHEALTLPLAHGELGLAKRWRIGRVLRARRYDQAIVLPNSWKSALIPVAAHIARRTGYVGELRYGLLNDWRVLDKNLLPLMVERFCALAEDAGAVPSRPLATLGLRVSPENQQRLLSALQLKASGPIACLCPGAEYGPAKRWPVEHFVRLAQELHQRGFEVWIMGSAKDAAIGHEIERGTQDMARDLCGKTGLDDAIDLIAMAALVVSNDSGLMHVAAALHRPMLALYGSSSPRFTPPLSDFATVIKDELPCSPCFKRECPLGHFDCMRKLTPERLLRHLDRLIERQS